MLFIRYGTMLDPLVRHATMPADLVDWASFAGDDVEVAQMVKVQSVHRSLDIS